MRTWRRVIARNIEQSRILLGDNALDQRLSQLGPVPFIEGTATVIADGMWRNPNHFFRLRLFISALADRGELRLLGILRSRSNASEKRALERIGFREFVYIDEDSEFFTDHFLSKAEEMLSEIRSHSDLLALKLPNGLPAYTFYDTVLKLTANPRPPVIHPQWRLSLAELLRNAKIYEREMRRYEVTHVVLSHPWKSEWAGLIWAALRDGVPAYHLTGFCEAIRIRRFRNTADYATPVEHLPRSAFDGLTEREQNWLTEYGGAALSKRTTGDATDINASLAYNPARRINDRETARQKLSGQSQRPISVIFSHVWYDFPHTFAMTNFTDFRDWIEATIAQISEIQDVVWLLKPHPTEAWYGGYQLADVAARLPPHVRLLPLETETQTVLTAADAVVTVHGTVGIEAAALGKTVLLADRSYFSDWDFAHVAHDRTDYFNKLSRISTLMPPDQKAQERARACFALAVAELPATAGVLPMTCDSYGSKLYWEIADRLADPKRLDAEIRSIGAFLDQSEIDSFASWRIIEVARSQNESTSNQ